MLKDISLSAVVAGLLAVIIAYSGPLIIVFQVATLAGVSTDMMMSWVWGISFGVGISGIILSYLSKMPIMTGWSVPGTVLLLSLFPTLSVAEMVGAHLNDRNLVRFLQRKDRQRGARCVIEIALRF